MQTFRDNEMADKEAKMLPKTAQRLLSFTKFARKISEKALKQRCETLGGLFLCGVQKHQPQLSRRALTSLVRLTPTPAVKENLYMSCEINTNPSCQGEPLRLLCDSKRWAQDTPCLHSNAHVEQSFAALRLRGLRGACTNPDLVSLQMDE